MFYFETVLNVLLKQNIVKYPKSNARLLKCQYLKLQLNVKLLKGLNYLLLFFWSLSQNTS